ncbi:MAG: sulfite exporter TauE/SafE family protein [Planctomycetota bacterium]
MPQLDDPLILLALVAVGLLAGTLGGLLGVGGSVVMIPALATLFGTGENQHLYQAAAMTVNVAVAIPAAHRHRKAGALAPGVLRWMLPAAVLAIVLGVLASNLPIFENDTGGKWLGRVLAVFLLYVIAVNLRKLRKPKAQRDTETLDEAKATPTRCGGVGGIMGFTAGLMGVGGGALAVPLQQTLARLPLRNAIANSSFVMVFSAAIGASLKLATLGGHFDPAQPPRPAWQSALIIAALLAPTAILGARLGAKLTHALPLDHVRVAFVLLMVVAALKMAAIPGLPI